MKKDFSPEEKLLRLIRKKKEPQKTEEALSRTPQPGEGVGQMGKMAMHREGIPKRAKSISIPFPIKFKMLNTRNLNGALILIFIGLLLYFVYDITLSSYKVRPEHAIEDEKIIPKVEKEDLLEIKPYPYYSSSIKGRNIFLPQQGETEPVITGPTLEEISSGFVLIGIIAGTRPQAVIEDRKTGKSYFLYEGGIIGQTKVVEILEDRIVMEYQGEQFELVL